MSADHNLNYYPGGVFPQSFCNQRVVSFQSGAVNSATGLNGGGISNMAGLIMAENHTSMMNYASSSSMSPQFNSSGNVLLDASHSPRNSTTLVAEWSDEELAILLKGLVKYVNESNILKYIKIAALLPDKTVRDVAMRCRLTSTKEYGKRRKSEDYYAGKKIKDRKEKTVASSSVLQSSQQKNTTMCSFPMLDVYHNNNFSSQAPVVDSATQHRLDENVQLLNRIERNLAMNMIDDNINLFYLTRDNITAILQSMSEMPGIMSQMPSLPEAVNENLIHSLLPRLSQVGKKERILILKKLGFSQGLKERMSNKKCRKSHLIKLF